MDASVVSGKAKSSQVSREKLVDLTVAVRDIIAEILEVEPSAIDGESHLVEDLGMDSMMALEILATVERRFRIKIAEENLPNMTSLNRIVEITRQYVRC